MKETKTSRYTRDTLKAGAIVMLVFLPGAFLAFGFMLTKIIGIGG